MRKKKLCLSRLLPVIAALLVLVMFRTVFILGYVPTNSMKPTLEAGSLILGVRIKGSFEVGDVVIFSSVLQRLVGMWSCITESTCLYPKAPTTCWETMRMTPMIPVTGTTHLYQ